jgi:hypothetical protein
MRSKPLVGAKAKQLHSKLQSTIATGFIVWRQCTAAASATISTHSALNALHAPAATTGCVCKGPT